MKNTAFLFAALLLVPGFSFAQRGNGAGEVVGTPWVGGTGITESVAEIMAREKESEHGAMEAGETEAEKVWPDRHHLPQNPLSQAGSQWPPAGNKPEPPGVSPFSPQTPGLNFTGATLGGINPTNAFPPDDMGAVGPTQYIIAVNGRIVTFSKTTGVADGALNVSTNTFFNSVRNGSGTSDPRICFDRLTGRWFIIIINVPTPNRVLIAVSNVGTITGSANFTFFFFQQNTVSPAGDATCLMDYPTLGVDANAMYIGGNQFCPGFNGTVAFVVQKSSVLGAGPIVVSAFRNLTGSPSGPGPFTPQGVDNFDPAATEGYIIGTDNASFGTLMLRRVSNPGGTPTLSANISIATPLSTSEPLDIRHEGNTNEGVGGHNGRLDPLDDRLFAAHFRNGSLWTAHNIGVNNAGSAGGTASRTGSRWYELQGIASPGTPTVVQSGTVFAASAGNTTDQRNYWIPSIMVSGQSHAAMTFSTAGTNEFANAATVGRLSGDAPGTMQTPVLFTSSTTAYNPSGDPGDTRPRRWGDYTYVSLDPNDDMTMWAVSQFCDVSNSYGCRIVQLLAPPPSTPSSSSPPSIAAGQTSVSVTITGTSVTGSGFFDPGTGFANHISASVTGGVVVNSAAYVNPTTVTLNLNTSGATAGAKNVTVTNPDGQSLTGNSILTITGTTPAITVTVPNGGETWPVGSSHTITWTSNGVAGNVKVELSRNAGTSYEVLFANTANDGSEPWVVTGPVSANALVRVSSVGNPSVLDVSDGSFAIIPAFTLLTKIILRDNGGESDSLEFGTAAGATDSIDALYGEVEQPPVPPGGVFDVRWQIAGTQGTKRDIRDTLGGLRQLITYKCSMQPGAGGYPFVVRWNRTELTGGTFTLRDGSGGTFAVDMKQQDSLVIASADVQVLQIIYGNAVSSTVQGGWNIVSVPVTVNDRRRTSVFPTSISNAFAFTATGYANRDTLEYGQGYWLKFPSTQLVSLSGTPMTRDTITVAQGWNIIGSISGPVAVGSIVQIPDSIVASNYFGYVGGAYTTATSINPMQGYWVKVRQNGRLVLSGGVSKPVQIQTRR